MTDIRCLSESDIKAIELSEIKALLDMQKVETLKLKQQVIQLKAKNYELISQLKQYEINESTNRANTARSRHTEFMNTIKEKYEITAVSWGYDPISGEIKE